MKNLLLIMPSFMEYDNVLFNELQKTYNVTLINSDFFAMDILREYSNKNIIHKFLGS